MNIELSRDAVLLKMKSRWSAPLISSLEYSYAAGLGLRKMGTEAEIKELVKASDVWGTFEQGEKLKNMLLSCRVKDKLDENTRLLFDMGYQG